MLARGNYATISPDEPLLKQRHASDEERPPAVEYISVVGMLSHWSPAGLHLYACEFLEAAHALPALTAPFSPVRAYLACRSIELALKAYLNLTGIPLNKLAEKKYGHDLKRLEKESTKLQIQKYVTITPLMRTAIRTASPYNTGKVFEYPKLEAAIKAYPNLPEVSVLMAAAELLVISLKEPCENA